MLFFTRSGPARAWAWACAPLLVLAAGCATRSADVLPRTVNPEAYAKWPCERLADEIEGVQQRAAELAYSVDSRVGNNMIALGLGVTVFWPALLAMRPAGPDAEELAELKGRFEAMRYARQARACGPISDAMHSERAAGLPVALGERLVYEDRAGGGAAPRELGMRVLAFKREQIEFAVDADGQALPGLWRQDLAGNPVLESRTPLIGWQRLLRRNLELGQVLAGGMAAPDEPHASARVRGQVVAVGPLLVAGRRFDAAVIELYGEAPSTRGAHSLAEGSSRLDGVMSVDRASGVLLRLELRCANADFSLRRRLLRVEAAAP